MRQSPSLAVTLLATLLIGGCRDAEPNNAGSAAETARDDDRVEAIVVDSFPAPDRSSQWLLVDLTSGVAIDGASRVVVEAPNAELGCGVHGRAITMPPVARGDTVTFEPVNTNARPPSHITREWDSVVLVGARRLRIACPADAEQVAAELAHHRATWDAAGIDTYTFTLHWGGLVASDFRITVTDGQTTNVALIDDTDVGPGWRDDMPGTIDALFDRLEREATAHRMSVRYHTDLGYPVAAFIDRIQNAHDDELNIHISDLTVVTTQ